MQVPLKEIFSELDQRIEDENLQRRASGALVISTAQVVLLGQLSLIVHKKVSALLHLAQTADMKAPKKINNLYVKPLRQTPFQSSRRELKRTVAI